MVISKSNNIKIVDCDISNLWFDEDIPYLAFKSKLPFLCDTEYNVLFGNYFFRDKSKKCKCIFIRNNPLLEESLLELERFLVNENSMERLHALDTELLTWLNNEFTGDIEQLSLFSSLDICEKGTITEEAYIKPTVDHEHKPAIKKDTKSEEEDDFSLFDFEEDGGIR